MYFQSAVIVVMCLCLTKAATIEKKNKNHYVVEGNSNDNVVDLRSNIDTQLDQRLKEQLDKISSMENKKLKDNKREDFFTLAIMAGLIEYLHKTAQKDKITEDVKNGIGELKNNNSEANRIDEEITELSDFLHRLTNFKDVKGGEQDVVTIEDIEHSLMLIQHAFNVTVLHDEIENGNEIETDNLIEKTLQTLNTSFHEELQNRKPITTISVISTTPGAHRDVTIQDNDKNDVAGDSTQISISSTNIHHSTETKLGYVLNQVKKTYVNFKKDVENVGGSFAYIELFRNHVAYNNTVASHEPVRSDNILVRAATSIDNILSFFGKLITGRK